MMSLRGGYPYIQNSPWCLKRLSKKDLKESIHSEEEGKEWIWALNGLERTNLMSEILQVSIHWQGETGSRARILIGCEGLVVGGWGGGLRKPKGAP